MPGWVDDCLAAELHDTNIHVNAISPVAATRILRRNAPELSPELVAPGAAYRMGEQVVSHDRATDLPETSSCVVTAAKI